MAMKFSTFLKGVVVAFVANHIFNNKQDASPKKTPASTSGGAEGNVLPVEVQPAGDKPNNTTDVAKEVEDGKQSDKVSDKPKDSGISDKKDGQQDHLQKEQYKWEKAQKKEKKEKKEN